MILEKLSKQENFTEIERNIANYILDFDHSIVGMTSSELGKVTYTSQSAVVRLYKKIGIDNYKTFYSILIEEIAIRKNMRDVDFNNPIKKDMTLEEIINIITNYYIQEIINSKLSINKNVIQRLYNHLKAAESIEVYAMGRDIGIAIELVNKLLPFNVRINYVDAFTNLGSNHLNEDKKIIIISLEEDRLISSENIDDISLDKIYVFGILGNYNSSMKKLCKDYIEISNGDND